jgi:hypothetical protein
MTAEEKTLKQLRYLETLYHQGYRSDTIARSLEKIIALERARAQRELDDLRKRLQSFEARYHMSSEDFYRRFRAGELGDAMDLVEWSVFYDMWKSVWERLEILEAESA